MLAEVGRWYNNYVPDLVAARALLEPLVLAHGAPAVLQGYTDLLARIAEGRERQNLPQRLSRYAGETARQLRAKQDRGAAAERSGKFKRLPVCGVYDHIFVRDGETDEQAIYRATRAYNASLTGARA
jgi:hypothetical protein